MAKRRTITGSRRRVLLFGSCIEDFVGAEHPVRAYDAFVDQIDFSQLGIELETSLTGPPDLDPRALTKLLVYGYSCGFRSSRRLARATYHNVSFIWLMAGSRPDHKTIARFRRNHTEALKTVLKECARVGLNLGAIEGNTVIVDGTEVPTNASMKHTLTVERCKQSWQRIERRIEEILEECEQIDQREQQ